MENVLITPVKIENEEEKKEEEEKKNVGVVVGGNLRSWKQAEI